MHSDMRNDARSASYQWKIVEIPCEHEFLGRYSNEYRLDHLAEPFFYQEQYYELQSKLLARVLHLAPQCLSSRQLTILKMYYLGEMTQVEISKILGVLPNTVCKSLIGTPYKTKVGVKQQGSTEKLRKFLLQDAEVQNLLQQMSELVEERSG